MTTVQALELGYTYKEIRILLRRGEWVRVRHGAYTSGSAWDTPMSGSAICSSSVPRC